MKDIRQIRENYNIITEKEEADVRKLTSLVRAGLFDSKKLPILKRAMEKDPSKLTTAERKVLLELLDSLMSEVLHSNQVYSKVKSNVGRKEELSEASVREKDFLSKYDPRYEADTTERELPSVIILKRKAIRTFPGRQKIGLYYSQSLDKYVSIPFGPGEPSMNEETDLNEVSAQYKAKKLSAYATKTADMEDDNDERDLSKNLEIAKRQVRAKTFLKKAFKDKDEREAASKVVNKSVQDRKDYLKSYDAPRKKGQLSNLTKGFLAGKVDTPEYVGTQVGLAAGKLIDKLRGKRAAKSMPEEKQIDEVAPLVALGVGAARVGASLLARRGAGAAASAAGKAAGRNTVMRNLKARALRTGRAAERAANVAGAAGSLAGGGGGSPGISDTTTPERTYTQPKDFSMKVQGVDPKSAGSSETGVDKRMQAAIRKSLSESIKVIAEGNYDNVELVIGEEKISINTTIAKKINNLYESLNTKNKKKMKSMLNEGDIVSFRKVLDFAVRQ